MTVTHTFVTINPTKKRRETLTTTPVALIFVMIMLASISVEMLAIFKNIFSVLFSIVEKMLCNKKCVQNKKAVNVK